MKLSAGRSNSRKKWLGAWAVTAVAVASMGIPGQSDGATASSAPASAPTALSTRSGGVEVLGNYDVRILSGDRRARADTRHWRANGKAVTRLSRGIGVGSTVAIDPLTGTPTEVSGRVALTTPSSRSAAAVALDYVRYHRAAFGLELADLSTLVKVREYTDVHGVTHVFWAQQVAGERVFGNGLRAHVDRKGRLISVQGAPVPGLDALARRAPAVKIGSSAAIRKAVTDARLANPDLRPGATADRVWFVAPDGLRPAWLTYTEPGSAASYEHVIDANTGVTLYRHSTTNFEGSGDAFVHENYPGARGTSSGGRLHHVNLIKRGFLKPEANFPKGKYVTSWPDLNDDNKRQKRETTRLPKSREEARQMRLKPFPTAPGELSCTKAYVCTWDPSEAFSWRKNMAQDAIQGLYLTSRYAKWLEGGPFGFNRASGNFTRKDGDPVDLNGIDGANTDHGFPDGDHVNNANFQTPPDGKRPRMQMYLNFQPYLAASSNDDFLTLAHEFTHGLSNRLVVNSNNRSTLNSYQAGAMGEAWSDFYAFDYVLFRNYATNTDAPGELTLDLYLAKNKAGVTRTQAVDCGLGEVDPNCVQFGTGDDGGYTYDDVGDGQLGTEVHLAGEVWAQTLFDIRERLGHRVTMAVVTEGMRLSPDNPSMLDMRDAIIDADEAIYGGTHVDALWRKFADRGFGFYAGSENGSDSAPAADFSVPPPADNPTGRIAGTVTDTSGNPIANAVVRIQGHSEFTDTTGADGKYKISQVPAGTWPSVLATHRAGYEPASEPVTVTGGERVDYNPELRRDWASAAGGASIASFTGPDFGPFNCGPANAIDLSQVFGWSTVTRNDGTSATSPDQVDPQEVVIELPQEITATAFAVNPTANCGDGGSASTADFEIYVAATPAGPWGSPVADGTFTVDDRNTMVEIPLGAPIPNVGAVRYVMITPQVPDWNGCPGTFSGCDFIDTTEIAAYDD